MRATGRRAPGAGTDLRADILTRAGPGFDPAKASEAAAISEAAYKILLDLYPKKGPLLDVAKLRMSVLVAAQEAGKGGDSEGRIAKGTTLGDKTAEAILALRSSDNSGVNHHRDSAGHPVECTPKFFCYEDSFTDPPPSHEAIEWTQDPVSLLFVMLGSDWRNVAPFVYDAKNAITPNGIKLTTGKTLAFPKPPDPKFAESLKRQPSGSRPDPHGGIKPQADKPANQAALDLYVYGGAARVPHGPARAIPSKYSVQWYGGLAVPPGVPLNHPPNQTVPFSTRTDRSQTQTTFAQFWGYDAVAMLCAPPRLYNMIATSIALDHIADKRAPRTGVGMARYLALSNMALADAAIAGWGGKYTYKIARPVTYFRDAAGGNDPKWTPFGQVASNGQPLGTSPPFPAYPSGHATFGGAFFQMLAHLLDYQKTDPASKFDFVSDEFNGETIGGDGRARPYMKVHYASLESAEWENAESRIWLGVHWQQDGDDGIKLGNDIADKIYATTLKRLH